MGRAVRRAEGRAVPTMAPWVCRRFAAGAAGDGRAPLAIAGWQGATQGTASATRGTAGQMLEHIDGRDVIARPRRQGDRRCAGSGARLGRCALRHRDPSRRCVAGVEAGAPTRFPETLSPGASEMARPRALPARCTCRNRPGVTVGGGTGRCAGMAGRPAAPCIDHPHAAPLRIEPVPGRH